MNTEHGDINDEVVDLAAAAAEYLRLRRSLGWQLEDHGRIIGAFLADLTARGVSRISVVDAVAYASRPAGASRVWHATRLAMLRGFADYVHTQHPDAAELIPQKLIPGRNPRKAPFLFSDREISQLMAAAGRFQPAATAAAMCTLIGMMVSTGIRIGEALGANIEDLSADHTILTVTGKYHKQRLVPLHPSCTAALTGYLHSPARPPSGDTGPILLGVNGTRLPNTTAHEAFRQIADDCHFPARPGGRRPVPHGLRHTFAVNTLIDAHLQGADVDARIAALATYLGHTDPANTYWYLTATPELMTIVSARIRNYLSGILS